MKIMEGKQDLASFRNYGESFRRIYDDLEDPLERIPKGIREILNAEKVPQPKKDFHHSLH